MKKGNFLMLIIFLIMIINCKADEKLSHWDNVIKEYAPKELNDARVIRRDDITDPDNLAMLDKYNPDFIIINDLNKNGKMDVFIPCISRNDNTKWYVVILEEQNNSKYKFIMFFSYELNGFYMMEQKNQNYLGIRLGQSSASDVYTAIEWDGNQYVSKKISMQE